MSWWLYTFNDNNYLDVLKLINVFQIYNTNKYNEAMSRTEQFCVLTVTISIVNILKSYTLDHKKRMTNLDQK